MKAAFVPALSLVASLLATVTSLPAVTPDLPPPEATEVWSPVPPIVSAPAGAVPSDAVVLFDGKTLTGWESVARPGAPAAWKVEDGALVVAPGTGDIRTKQAFGDIQLHLEWREPADAKGSGQSRGNSGVFFMGLYELQVLDSYDNQTYSNGQVGSIYKQHIPLVNPARKPGEWQTYDVVWIAPRFGADGKLLKPARMTAFQNGVLVQYDAVLRGPTAYRGTPAYTPHPPKLPLALQDHGSLVAFRNIWVREITLPESK